jgi:uroporphyrinogen III methyltransferase/synthase
MIFMNVGKVYLVGAGPGDPDLVTLKALKLLKKAEVVVYDRLVPRALFRMIPKEAEKIYVGKRPGFHASTQNEITQIIVKKALNGKQVIRLKGGDPFLFGRGGEEAQDLVKANVRFEVVPGITSALAAPAFAGIPLTHRRYASSMAIVTGHQDMSEKKHRVNWRKLATTVDTIIILMGVGRLRLIVDELVKGGCRPSTPTAVIEWATTRRQRTIMGTLGNIVARASNQKVKPPAVIVIGDIVNLRKKLAWFEGEKTCQ